MLELSGVMIKVLFQICLLACIGGGYLAHAEAETVEHGTIIYYYGIFRHI